MIQRPKVILARQFNLRVAGVRTAFRQIDTNRRNPSRSNGPKNTVVAVKIMLPLSFSEEAAAEHADRRTHRLRFQRT